jgi:hypothetical protein
MSTGRYWSLLIGITASFASLGGVTYHKSRSKCLCGLPCYDYVYGTISNTESVFSLDPVEFGGPPEGSFRGKAKYFQMSHTSVQLDQCFLSRVALTLEQQGFWTLSLRADQNPWMTGPNHEVTGPFELPGAVSALHPLLSNLEKETDGLKRNQFFVRVRCYGGYPLREPLPAATIGKPVLFELPVAAFWVQRGFPYDLWTRQPMPDVARCYDLVNRVEVEFWYR